jgi:hypothetical protein
MLTLVVILAAGGYYGWLGVTEGWFEEGSPTATEETAPEETCTTPPPVVVRARQVRVSVYNAGAPVGQAGQVMDALAGQGFRQGEVSDAPGNVAVGGVVVWPGRADADQARLVQEQFRNARLAQGRRRALGPGVNVLVGNDFLALSPQAPRRIEVEQPEECTSSG